jgi:steroid 5-alpha reductase family enzyme
MIKVIFSHLIFFSFAFLVAKKFNKISIVDLFWSLGLMLPLFYLYFYFKRPFHFYQLITSALVIAWGLRLFFYLYFRTKGKGDDPRYLAMVKRKNWGWKQIYFGVFIAQGIFSLIIGIPFYFWRWSFPSYVNDRYFWMGFILALLGFFLESYADFSLGKFKSEPKNSGKLCTVAPWSWSRHPNYLGELMFWWGIWIISLSFHPVAAIAGIVSPLLLSYLIIFVTGIGPKEKALEKYPEFVAYKLKVRKFL